MAATDLFVRCVKRYILNIESFILIIFVVTAYSFLFNADHLWFLFTRMKEKVDSKLKSYESDRFDVTQPRDLVYNKVTWTSQDNHSATYAIQGRRPHMEDRFSVVSKIENTSTSLYGVFDGHGGDFTSDFTYKTLFKSLIPKIVNKKDVNIPRVLTDEILKTDDQVLEMTRSMNDISGSTALVAVVHDDILTVANVGDSRGVLCDSEGRTVPLSFDHKPQNDKEKDRIIEAGGFVSFDGVWRVAGILATSRALGDLQLKEANFLIAEPDILSFDLKELKPEFMILATDGLWDTFTNEGAVSFIKSRLHEQYFGARSLAIQAYKDGSYDNITVMVVKLR